MGYGIILPLSMATEAFRNAFMNSFSQLNCFQNQSSTS